MGTNYYAKRANVKCGKEYHIGKSSGGWCFALHVEGTRNSLSNWLKFLVSDDFVIYSDTRRDISIDALLHTICGRKGRGIRHGFDFVGNQAELGPNGLVSRELGGNCVGHGAGTWDLISGEFC